MAAILFVAASVLSGQASRQVRNPHGPLKIACENCHTTTGWSPIRPSPEFDHNRETRYPLRGMHTGVACASCHTQKVFTNVGQQCADCHADIHRRQFGASCADCHTVRGWRVAVSAMRNHLNRFPLIGAHATAQCESCHVNAAAGQFTGLSTDCVSCHMQDYVRGRPLDHRAANLPLNCTGCHQSMDRWQGARFDHSQFTKFALQGAHLSVACAACHQGGRFVGTPVECYGCHAKDYTAVKDPNHISAGFPRDCTVCHTQVNWQNAKFDHATTSFALTGAHSSVACASCHAGNRFAGTTATCSGCHLPDYQKTTNPNHRASNLSQQCETCHTTATWRNAKFDHNLSRFPLTGSHTSAACASCHVAGKFTGTPSGCYDCHQQAFQTATPNHVAAGFPQDCAVCHTTAQWKGAKFDHGTTKFALTGAHTSATCAQCHTTAAFAGTPTACNGCHLADFNAAKNPPHATGGFPQDCALCHTTAKWIGAKFDHGATKFPLTGSHKTVQCTTCHTNSNYAATPMDCFGCHAKEFQATTNPNHSAAGFSTTCTVCHTTTAWRGATFDHAKTGFTLTGAHTNTACAQCHAGGRFANTPMTCSGCHLKDFNGTKSPNHVAAGFPQDCTLCHNTSRWLGAKFDHSTTKFPLTGAHIRQTCTQCHVNGNFAAIPVDCFSCHQKDFQATKNPNHAAAGFSTVCSVCHSTANWQNAVFDHNKTPFTLTGAHITTNCALCHGGNKFAGTPMDCASCHLADFNKTTSPNHPAAGFPTTCTMCHTTAKWSGATFDHNRTPFPLTGSHTSASCAQCHMGGKFAGTPNACVDCHLSDFKNTVNPNHVNAGLPQNCTLCHTTTRWRGATFDHSKTAFTLTGAHSTTSCAQCHTGGRFAGTPTGCAGCHLKTFNQTTNPNHVAAAFPQDCSLCHSTIQWLGAKFDHSKTRFLLTGAHPGVACASCHTGGRFSGTPQDCASCHSKDFQNTRTPNHAAAGFPTTCNTCHNTTAWSGAVFDHSRTPFPLTGSHSSIACGSCHTTSNFAQTPTDCYACHRVAFQNTRNPNHASAGFSTNCASCHTTVRWAGAVFDHSRTPFPLTGSHTSVACASCHTTGNYAQTPTDCNSCHQRNFQGTRNPNHVTSGFPTTCATCHTTASWVPSTFNHSRSAFPLTGAHTSVACATCHVNNNFTTIPTDCFSCHRTTFTNTRNPNHTAVGFATACSNCHNTTTWANATFNHASTGFTLTGAHITTSCGTCHTGATFTRLPMDCYGCHRTTYQNTRTPNHVAAGFPTDCSLCHSTTNWTSATFDHNRTVFPLTGRHTSVACGSCHVNNNYTTVPTDCYSCHRTTYQNTRNPNHVAAGFPTTCNTCHSTANWTSATFDHNRTIFPLTGRHTSVACGSCHVNNNYTTVPTDCYSCHRTTFLATTNPNHTAARFPTTCNTCHTTTSWAGATFNHTWFPTNHGNAGGVCATCHTNSANYTVFTCTNCHTQTQTDSKHRAVRNYVYSSPSCYSCHPRGTH